MLQLARDRLVPGKIQLNGSSELLSWQIVNPDYALVLAIERYVKRHALAVPWMRVQGRQRGGVIWGCQLLAFFAGAEEDVWRLLVAAIEEWNAERAPHPREDLFERPQRTVVVEVAAFKHILDDKLLSHEPPSGSG